MCNLDKWALLKLELGEEDATPRVFKMSKTYRMVVDDMGDEPEDKKERQDQIDSQRIKWKKNCSKLIATLYTIIYNDMMEANTRI